MTMGILDNLGSLLKQVQSGNAADADVHGAYDQLAGSVPADTLAGGLAHAFNSDQTPPFPDMVSGLFAQSNPQQKAGLLNQIIAAVGPAGAAQLATSTGLGGLAGMLSGGNVTPQQAQQVTPDQVQVLAQNAAKKNPSIVDMAAGFYAQHPTLVKSIGVGALALLMSKISKARS
jgi:hypothetical protein